MPYKVEACFDDVLNVYANDRVFGDQTGVDSIFAFILLTSPHFEFGFADYCGCKLNILDPEISGLLVANR